MEDYKSQIISSRSSSWKVAEPNVEGTESRSVLNTMISIQKNPLFSGREKIV